MCTYNYLTTSYTNELYHYGVKGMKWGVRRFQNQNGTSTPAGRKRYDVTSKNAHYEATVLYKNGENVELHQSPKSSTAKFLARLIPSIQRNMDAYKDYSIKSKDGTKVGTVSTNKDSDESLNIVWIGVKDKYSGNGYGQSAMRTVIDDAKKSGFRNITLEVPTNSPNARHIYEKLGFKETGEAMLGDEDDVWGGLTKMRLDL